MKNKPTPPQRRILRFIMSYKKENGIPPSRLEIAWHMGHQPSSVQQQLMALHRKGYLRIIPKIARGIVVL